MTLGRINDPGNDSVTTYVVDWGDGSSNTYTAGGNVTHTYADGPGLANITVGLVDEDGSHDSAGTLGLRIDNADPVALNDPEAPASYTLGQDSSLAVSPEDGVLANDSDPGKFDQLEVTQINGFDFSSGDTIVLPSGAKLTVHADGSFEYDPNDQFDSLASGETGTDSFEYTVSDGEGGIATATAVVTIFGLNDPPTIGGGPSAGHLLRPMHRLLLVAHCPSLMWMSRIRFAWNIHWSVSVELRIVTIQRHLLISSWPTCSA